MICKKLYKNTLFLLIITITFFSLITPNFQKKQSVFAADDALILTAKSAYLTDAEAKNTLYEKDSEKQLPIASMCKIMTLDLIFHGIEDGKLSMDDKIPVSEEAAGMGGSQAFLRAHEDYLASDLIKSIVIASANDSCYAMAEYLSGSAENFVSEMNRQAENLGMKNTVFQNCTGLPKPGQFSTAKDVSIMLSDLIRYPDYFRFTQIWTDKICHADGTYTELTNTNKLTRFYDGCDGGKTGFTEEAKFCLAATATRGNLRLISVIIGADDSKTRFNENCKLFNYGFANFVGYRVIGKEDVLNQTAPVRRGTAAKVSVRPSEDVYLLSKRGETPVFETEAVFRDQITAPVAAGQNVGSLRIVQNGTVVKEIPLLSTEEIGKRTFKTVLYEVIDNFNLVK